MGKSNKRKKSRKIINNKRKTQRKINKMNCNPGIKPEIKNSCYTSIALNHIKDGYNRMNSNKITSSDSIDIWNELRNNLTECPREDCWLKQIKDNETRRQLDELLFAPDRPNEWDKNPVAWLSNYDIAAVLRQYEKSHSEFKLLGPSALIMIL